MERFNIPVALFIFKRRNTLKSIIERISTVKPTKIYIIADGPRNEYEKEEVIKCREEVEKLINWNCEIIKNYSEKNRGVYENIAGGAKWVFEREESAIFLEDDNLPEVTFFEFCKQMLTRYEQDDKILWICGTNYLQKYTPLDGSDYIFTKHLMPCGWASWSKKFNKYYDGQLECLEQKDFYKKLKKNYENKSLYKQQAELANMEKDRMKRNLKPLSWDYQMAISIRANNLYGISPKYNQIENIGVDENSIHGGNTYDYIMTKRFCTIKTYPLVFPLKHPKDISLDKKYEKLVGDIILYPLGFRIKNTVAKVIKKFMGLNYEDSIKGTIREKIRKIRSRND